MRKKILAVGSALLLVAGLISLGASPAIAGGDDLVGTVGELQPWSAATNQADYWKDAGPHDGAACFKQDADSNGMSSNDYGSSNGTTVTLNTFNQAWQGDHWELLVIKGGSDWNDVIVHPTSGVAYASPLNSGGMQSNVSHWIVCMGTTPTPPPTTVERDAVAGVASVTPATCDVAGTLVLAAGIHASWGAVTYSGDGDLHYSVTATAEPGHTFADGSATVLVTGTLAAALTGDQCDPTTVDRDAVAGEVTTTAATCDVAQTLVLGAGTYASWGAVTYSGEGNLHYTVTATAAAGHAFVDGSTTFVVTGTLAGALTSAQCYQEPPTVVRDAVAGAVTTTAATCDVAETLVLGAGTHASWGAVTYSGEANLHYSVTSTAAHGHAFADGSTTFVVTGTLSPKLSGPDCIQLPDHPLVTPLVTSTNISCTAAGSYRLAEANGIADGIIWTVDGTVVQPGTYSVKTADTVHVTAVPNGIDFGFDFGIDNPSTWTLTFTAAQACGDLTTLALPGDNTLAATGADTGTVNFGLLFAGGLLLLGGALLVADRKFRYGK